MSLNRCHKSEHKKFLADKNLYHIGICYWIIGIIEGFIGIFLGIISDSIEGSWLFFIMFVIHNVVCLCVLPKWRIVVELTKEGIYYKPTFKKGIKRKYSDFGYFNCATYTHYKVHKYIVFSQRRLNDYELTHINNVAVSDKLIKIKVRKGLKEDLSSFLPPKFLCRIPKDFW